MKIFFKLGIVGIWIIVLGFALFDDTHSYTRIMFHELYEQEENVDIVLLGASHVYRGIDPFMMKEYTGSNVFNASSSSQQLKGSYYILNEVLKENNVSKVLLDTNYGINNLEKDGDIQTYIITDYLKNSYEKEQYLFSVGGFDALVSDCFPVFHALTVSNGLKNPINIIKNKLSTGYREYGYDLVSYDNEKYKGKGFVYSNEEIDILKANWSPNPIDGGNIVPQYTKYWLEKIIALCKEKNVELILIDCPVTDASIYGEIENYSEYIAYMSELSEKNDLKYWNFNMVGESKLNKKSNWYKDAVHFNGKGAESFTAFLSGYLNDPDENIFYDSLELKFENKDYDDTVEAMLSR